MKKNDVKELHLLASKGRKHSDILFDLVWTHCLIVNDICRSIYKKLPKDKRNKIDLNLVEIGALIHDVGVYFCFIDDLNPEKKASEYFYHGIMGEKFLIGQGITDPKIVRFTTVHVGVGITKQNIVDEKLKLPLVNYVPISLEEKLVTYADKFHSKIPRFVNFDEARNKLVMYGEEKGEKLDILRQEFGLFKIEEIEAKYCDWHKNFRKKWEDVKFK